MDDLYSLYLHVPFCRHRCSYCDFNTYAGQDHLRGAYVAALVREIELAGERAGRSLPVHTVFFGGGTPSLLSLDEYAAIFAALRQAFNLLPDAEITIEANPGTVSPEYLAGLRAVGVNRLSMGMQSAHPDDLRLLERQHDTVDVIRAVSWARQAGFEQISLDLMFGLPEQPLVRWAQTLESALALGSEHLSLYALTLEHGTPFQHWTDRGLIPTADPDLAADMYELAMDRLGAAGFCQYEISNWARPHPVTGRPLASRHNLQYWLNRPYLGLGAGAHGYAGDVRTANVLGIGAYIKRMTDGDAREFPLTPATVSVTPIDRQTAMEESMMVGLRLTEWGVRADAFARRFGQTLEETFPGPIAECLKRGLLEWVEQPERALRLTQAGRLLGNQVFMRFIGETA